MAVYTKRTGLALTVGIIILSLVALGGLYLVKNQGEQARREEAVKVAEERLKAESEQEVALENGAANESVTEEETVVEEGSQSGDDQSASAGAGAGTGANTGAGQGNGGNVAAAEELPQTGSSEVLTAVALGVLTFSVATYAVSRNNLRRML